MFCRHCGQEINDKAIVCVKCGKELVDLPSGCHIGDDAGIRALIPVGRSGYAIAAGYLGLFSVLFFPAPLAVIFGILGIRDIKKNSQKHGMGRSVFALVMGILFSIPFILLLIFTVIGILIDK